MGKSRTGPLNGDRWEIPRFGTFHEEPRIPTSQTAKQLGAERRSVVTHVSAESGL
jgi:hypothetical protein